MKRIRRRVSLDTIAVSEIIVASRKSIFGSGQIENYGAVTVAALREAQARQRAASRDRPPLQFKLIHYRIFLFHEAAERPLRQPHYAAPELCLAAYIDIVLAH